MIGFSYRFTKLRRFDTGLHKLIKKSTDTSINMPDFCL